MARSVPKKYWKVMPFMLRKLCTSVGRSMLLFSYLCHLHSLDILSAEVKTLAEVLVGLRLAEVNLAKIGIGAVVEYHTSAPPFLWQYSAMSLTIDWNDCVWQ